MRTDRRRPARRAFSLIELLVSISIIATLTGLTLAGIGKIRGIQLAKSTENTLNKIQLGLDQQWKAVLDQVKQDKLNKKIPPQVLALADNDPDRAEALWAYVCLRREFPDSIGEAVAPSPVTPPGKAYGVLTVGPPGNQMQVQPRATFASLSPVLGLPVTQQPGADLEAAVLLYIILNDASHRGMVSSMGDISTMAQGSVTFGGTAYPVFIDAWGAPITFRRFYGDWPVVSEIQQAPFVNSKTTNIDPMDPLGKLSNWPNKQPQGQIPYKLIAEAQVLVLPGRSFGAPARNKLITAISAGANMNKLPQPSVVAGASWWFPYWDPNHPDGLNGGDVLMGYRLHKQGNRGD
jgi:prepilin-type N-terminal cleavage/methylation domain-containing protein